MKTLNDAINCAVEIAKENSDEICGFILKNSAGDFLFKQCKNTCNNPEYEFEISDDDISLSQLFGEIKYVIHSHPKPEQLYHLSHADRSAQYDANDGMDWILIKPDFSYEVYPAIKKFKGRVYESNKTDCYTIMKDFYAMCGVDLPEFDRAEQWWNEGDNYYLDNVPVNGFYECNKTKLIPGDVMLFCVSSNVPNHCGIYIGDNLFIHHGSGRISKTDIVDRFWFKYCHSAWRHENVSSLVIDRVCNKIKGEYNG